jgi:hypothetical protein
MCSQENINSDLGRLGSADRKIDHPGVSSYRPEKVGEWMMGKKE